jgi:hypothetical protein
MLDVEVNCFKLAAMLLVKRQNDAEMTSVLLRSRGIHFTD